jgi:hypothetical protein
VVLTRWSDAGLGRRIQVKTRTTGIDGGWHMRANHEAVRDPGLIYAFVDLVPEPPAVHLVPSETVADVLAKSDRAWLDTPGRGGRAHRDHVMRRLVPAYSFEVEGYAGGWLEAYRGRWELLA